MQDAGTDNSNTGHQPAQWTLAAWQGLVMVALAALVGLLPGLQSLMPYWLHSFTYSHGFLILGISLWLLVTGRQAIYSASVKPFYWALIPLVGALFFWLLSFAANVEIGIQFLLPAILFFAIVTIMGPGMAKVTWFPIGFLYFAIPAWDFVNWLLQDLTVEVTSIILASLRVPAFITGNIVNIPSGTFEIAGGCSGLHFFIVALALGSLYGWMWCRSWLARGLLFAVAAAMALVANWLRVSIIIVAGHLTEMQTFLVQVDHYYFGWFVFAVMLVPYLWWARRVDHWDEKRLGRQDEKDAQNANVSRVSSMNVLWMMLLMLTPVLWWARGDTKTEEVHQLNMPTIEGWQGPDDYAGAWQPVFRGADAEAIGAYTNDGQQLFAYANWYATQAQGRELIGSGNRLAGDFLRSAEPGRGQKVSNENGAVRYIREAVFEAPNGARLVVWYWYRIGDKAMISATKAKLQQGLNVLLGSPEAGLIAIAAPCDGGCEDARELLRGNVFGFADAMNTSFSNTGKHGENEDT